ncbi:MAG: hypothetical protein ACYCWE_10380 [Eubacteriales bacterium]
MHDYDYPVDMCVGRVCLELSLKPFKKTDEETINRTCRELFEGWRELLHYASSCAVMLWSSDGSEILDYSGNIDDTFEWGRYIGIGNPKKDLPPCSIQEYPEYESLHARPVYYTENPAEMRYSDLRRIITAIKKASLEVCGMEAEVGATFDPGPEFAYSEFKFHRHSELARGNIMGTSQWIHCASRLHGDTHKYAAFPSGIPEGTHFGHFLGRQYTALAADVGFDYIWLSNGFGYSLNSWNWTGEVFNGESFDYSGAKAVKESIGEFWREFIAVIGSTRVETRGSNLSSGMDIAAHGSPLGDIYSCPNLLAPPNSPWAALNFRFGLELAGYMSHIAALPQKGYLFRFYTHDPWWHNSPWFDRYGRTPHDIYLPLSITRLDADGNVTKPYGINILSADDSYGNMPRRCPIEVTPHILDAYSRYPDEASILTWVYPISYYLDENKPDRIFMDDWFVENAIDNGLPLNTVISDENFAQSDMKNYRHTILIMPVPSEGTQLEKSLFKALKYGLNILLYGSTANASPELRALLGITLVPPLDGSMTITTTLTHDIIQSAKMPDVLLHDPLLSDGGICEKYNFDPEVTIDAQVTRGGDIRLYASHSGTLAWVRGSFPHAKTKGSLPNPLSAGQYFTPSVLLRGALELFGIKIRFITDHLSENLPIILNSRCNNALFISGFTRDTTMHAVLSYPEGAPLLNGSECILDENGAEYTLRRWQSDECRLFARQTRRTTVFCEIRTAEHPALAHRVLIRGLDDAAITFYPPQGAYLRMVSNKSGINEHDNTEKVWSDDGRCVTVSHLTGYVYVSWSAGTADK